MKLHPTLDPTQAMATNQPVVTERRLKETNKCPLQAHLDLEPLGFLGSECWFIFFPRQVKLLRLVISSR